MYVNYTYNGLVGYEEWFYFYQNNTSLVGMEIHVKTLLYQYTVTPIQYFSFTVLASALG